MAKKIRTPNMRTEGREMLSGILMNVLGGRKDDKRCS